MGLDACLEGLVEKEGQEASFPAATAAVGVGLQVHSHSRAVASGEHAASYQTCLLPWFALGQAEGTVGSGSSWCESVQGRVARRRRCW